MSIAATLIVGDEYPVPSDITGITLGKPVLELEGDVYKLSAEKVLEKFVSPKTLVVARGDIPVDSLAATAYAKANSYPVLLSKPGELPSVTLDAINKLNPSKVIIIGGTVAISEGVENELSKIATVERMSGATRYETAIEVAKAVKTTPSVIVVTQGYNPAIDAVIISAVYNAPLIYVDQEEIPQSVKDYLSSNKGANVLFVGVSEPVKEEIENLMK
jgi:putative cell wall-binding protein